MHVTKRKGEEPAVAMLSNPEPAAFVDVTERKDEQSELATMANTARVAFAAATPRGHSRWGAATKTGRHIPRM